MKLLRKSANALREFVEVETFCQRQDRRVSIIAIKSGRVLTVMYYMWPVRRLKDAVGYAVQITEPHTRSVVNSVAILEINPQVRRTVSSAWPMMYAANANDVRDVSPRKQCTYKTGQAIALQRQPVELVEYWGKQVRVVF